MKDNILDFYNNYKNKIKTYFNLLLVIGIFLSMYYLFYINKNENKQDNNEIVLNEEKDETILEVENNSEATEEKTIFVDVKGKVINPGVYELNENSRVIDAINASGGLDEEANTRYINLSKILSDGDVIVVYSNEEIDKAQNVDIVYVDMPCVCEEVNNACIDDVSSDITNTDEIKDDIESQNKLININTASLEELMTLDGIGESKANSIIEYRTNNGNFEKIEDIINVKGISENLYEKIKEYITI